MAVHGETILGGILLYRARSEESLSLLTKAVRGPTSHFRGFPQGLLALGMTAAEKDGAATGFRAAMRFLPRPGTSRGNGRGMRFLLLRKRSASVGVARRLD